MMDKLELLQVATSPKGVLLRWGQEAHTLSPDQADNLAILLIRASDRSRYMALRERGRDVKVTRVVR